MIDIKKEENKPGKIHLKLKELQFYSEYGYVTVLKSEFESQANFISCYKPDRKFQANIKVFIFLI